MQMINKEAMSHDDLLRYARVLSWGIAGLAILVSAVGLFEPSIYRETSWVIPQNRGQDLVTLAFAVPVFVYGVIASARGSCRALLVWFSVTG